MISKLTYVVHIQPLAPSAVLPLLVCRWLGISFLWGFFKWFYSGRACSICRLPGVICGGFSAFPTFGLQALVWKWVRTPLVQLVLSIASRAPELPHFMVHPCSISTLPST